jgi:tetratricopeptide (TPR) repeat protein
MSIDKPKDERRALYDKFKEELAQSNDDSATFFDEDDLVVIYDQASDLSDEYVQMEVLLHGYRYFPDSEQLAARKALLYKSYSFSEGINNTLNAHENADGVIWKMLRLLSKRRENYDTCTDIEQLLNSVEELDDETVIQLVDLAVYKDGGIQWLKENEALLRKKCTYLPTLLYELYLVMDMKNESEYATKKLEELTEMEPFNVDFWISLSECYYRQQKPDKSIAAVDYALALDSTNVAAIMAKAEALSCTDCNPQEVVDMLEPVANSDNFNERTLQLLCNALVNLHRNDEALKYIHKFIDEVNSWSREAIELLVCINDDDEVTKDWLEFYYTHAPEMEETDWVNWADEHYSGGNYKLAALILSCYDEQSHDGLSVDNHGLLASARYTAGMYSECSLHLQMMLGSCNYAGLTYEDLVTGVLSTIRMGNLDLARQLLPLTVEAVQHMQPTAQPMSVGTSLQAIGTANMLDLIHAFLSNQTPGLTIDNIDPFPTVTNNNA